ncbi:MAG TPA: hypothetical protein VJM14_06835 [Burkholderiales bacterium]|nr:hypothetical protein [Burkholderiales bacterium]
MSLALQGQQDGWAVAGMLAFLGLVGTACLMRLRITLTSDALLYRGVLRTARIPLHDIAAIHGVSIGREHSKQGLAKGPGFVLIIETIPAAKSQELSVSMKPFGKRDLRELFSAAESRGITVHLNAVAAAMVRG